MYSTKIYTFNILSCLLFKLNRSLLLQLLSMDVLQHSYRFISQRFDYIKQYAIRVYLRRTCSAENLLEASLQSIFLSKSFAMGETF